MKQYVIVREMPKEGKAKYLKSQHAYDPRLGFIWCSNASKAKWFTSKNEAKLWMDKAIKKGLNSCKSYGGTKLVYRYKTNTYQEFKGHWQKFLRNIRDSYKIETFDAPLLVNEKCKKNFKLIDCSSRRQKAFCHSCGAHVPGIKYLSIKSKSSWHEDVLICSFCLQKLADLSNNIAKRIPEELRKFYKAGMFLKKL